MDAMNIKVLSIAILLIVSMNLSAAENKTKTKQVFQRIFNLFQDAKYDDVISSLNLIEKKLEQSSKKITELESLVFYWKAMSYSRLNDYELAEDYFEKALTNKYITDDIFYEYGQVLYVSEKLQKARIAFKKSVQKKFKMAVSLYYIASISQELKHYKKAVSFYNMIEKIPKEESLEVLQAARAQIADIYLIKIEKQSDAFSGIKNYVIPQYEKAIKVNESSKLAETLRDKITELQRRYEIILFKMRNGRPTARPPHYIRANFLYGVNDNVTTISNDEKKSQNAEDYSSAYYTTGVFARYSIYPNSVFSYSPEFSTSVTKYLGDSESLLPYNTYYIKGALKTNFEHMYNNAPATLYFDLDYTYNADDSDADKSFAFATEVYGMTISEELQLFENNPSTFRFNYAMTSAEDESASFKTYGFSYEQLILFKKITLFWYNNLSFSKYDDSASNSLDVNALISRIDFIFPTFYNLFNPTVFYSSTSSNYINDSDKGILALSSIGMNINRPISKKWYLTLEYSQSTQVADQDADNYNQSLFSLNLDYIY